MIDDEEAARARRELLGEDDDDAVAVTEMLDAEEAHPILTAEEIAEIRAEARKKVEAERRSAARAEMLEREINAARRAAGLTTGGPNDEMVNITLDLAEHSEDIKLNGCSYRHGGTYRVPRHVAETMREIMYRGWKHQNEVDGKSLSQFYQKARPYVLNMANGKVARAAA
jgi:hypothetical protein